MKSERSQQAPGLLTLSQIPRINLTTRDRTYNHIKSDLNSGPHTSNLKITFQYAIDDYSSEELVMKKKERRIGDEKLVERKTHLKPFHYSTLPLYFVSFLTSHIYLFLLLKIFKFYTQQISTINTMFYQILRS